MWKGRSTLRTNPYIQQYRKQGSHHRGKSEPPSRRGAHTRAIATRILPCIHPSVYPYTIATRILPCIHPSIRTYSRAVEEGLYVVVAVLVLGDLRFVDPEPRPPARPCAGGVLLLRLRVCARLCVEGKSRVKARQGKGREGKGREGHRHALRAAALVLYDWLPAQKSLHRTLSDDDAMASTWWHFICPPP